MAVLSKTLTNQKVVKPENDEILKKCQYCAYRRSLSGQAMPAKRRYFNKENSLCDWGIENGEPRGVRPEDCVYFQQAPGTHYYIDTVVEFALDEHVKTTFLFLIERVAHLKVRDIRQIDHKDGDRYEISIKCSLKTLEKLISILTANTAETFWVDGHMYNVHEPF